MLASQYLGSQDLEIKGTDMEVDAPNGVKHVKLLPDKSAEIEFTPVQKGPFDFAYDVTKADRSHRVFRRSGRRLQSFRSSWKKTCAKAGLPGLLFHVLRRNAVTNLERAGVPRSVAMKCTGHKTESIYRRYAIVAESDLREAGAKLSALDGVRDSPVRARVTVSRVFYE